VNTTVVGSYPKIPDPPAPGRWRASVEKLQRGDITPAERIGMINVARIVLFSLF